MSDLLKEVTERFDPYSRRARLAPGLLLLFGPAAVAIGAGAPNWPVASSLVTAAVYMGLPVALADWVRRRGQGLQAQLWMAWGGNPAVVVLRGDGLIPARRRQALAAATGLPVDDLDHPDFEEVAGNAVRQLISATRDTAKYRLIFAENKSYGFARNVLAVQRVGILLSVAAVVTGVGLTIASLQLSALSALSSGTGTIVAAASIAFWCAFPSEERVHAAAEDYRDRLLDALDAGALPTERS